jgi:hypothetical protein
MCSECAGSYEDGDEELEGHGGAREARRFRTAPGVGGAHEWPDRAASIRTGSKPAHFASFEECYEVFVGADHILEVHVVRANVLVTPVLISSAGRQPSSEDTVRRPQYYQTCRFPAAPNQPPARAPSVRMFFAALAMVWAAAAGAWLIIK